MTLQMQARSSSNGQLYSWNSDSPDFAAAGYPGPGSAQDVAISMRPPAGSGSDPSARPEIFSSSTTDLTASSGTTTLTGPTRYRTVTLTGTAKIDRAGFPLWIQHFDATNAGVDAIFDTGTAGGDGVADSSSGNDGGAAKAATAYVGLGTAGGGGGDPSSGVGQNGSPATAATVANHLGGAGGAGGAGGTGTAGAGGSGGANGGTPTATAVFLAYVASLHFGTVAGALQLAQGGTGGGGGGSGSGNGAGLNGGTGAGGASGARPGCLYIGKITTGPSTPAGVISAKGGRGGNGANTANGTGNKGGGAGGGGGGGGYLYCIVGIVVGQTVAGFFAADGGDGGTGSAGKNTGTAGANGAGGAGGNIDLIQLHKNTATRTVGSAPSGATGGLCRADLTA